MEKRAAAMFVNHGGGPMPLLGEPSQIKLTQFLRQVASKWLGNPKGILLITAHWENSIPTISNKEKHELYFDYYNFPPETYKYSYPAPGSPSIAARVKQTLQEQGIEASLDSSRGWDHGLFVPMMLIAPNADIPIVQLSVLQSQDPRSLLKYGKALSSLRDEGYAIIGSGMSFHNMGALMTRSKKGQEANKAFESHLRQVLKLSESERDAALENWQNFPSANECHPKGASEHFSPLLVVAGAAGNDALKSMEVVECMGFDLTCALF